jgi:ATP-dependent helicase Lhr and Lhr-like helicase
VGTRLHGIDGTLAVIKQLEGYEIPAAAWESQILPRRIAGYKPEFLDRLCYSGDVMWGRISPHPALQADEDEQRRRRVRPTKLAPVSLFVRSSAESLIVRGEYSLDGLSECSRQVLAAIERRGAPFFAEIVTECRRLPAEVEEALWQLVAAGLVTADGFDALRSLIDAKRRLGEKGFVERPLDTAAGFG